LKQIQTRVVELLKNRDSVDVGTEHIREQIIDAPVDLLNA